MQTVQQACRQLVQWCGHSQSRLSKGSKFTGSSGSWSNGSVGNYSIWSAGSQSRGPEDRLSIGTKSISVWHSRQPAQLGLQVFNLIGQQITSVVQLIFRQLLQRIRRQPAQLGLQVFNLMGQQITTVVQLIFRQLFRRISRQPAQLGFLVPNLMAQQITSIVDLQVATLVDQQVANSQSI